ncbi:MAG TPA: hypothetical protein VNO33_24490 [Kofleriaceae bacterium]|nr:hypothetical protein [Kofleriaceae bacterium]
MKHIVTLIAMLAAAFTTACSPEVPDQPTWTEDVRPIVAANCIRCHSPPQLEDAPRSIRLDKFEGEDRDFQPPPDQPDVGDDGVDDFCNARSPDVCGAGTQLHDDTSLAGIMADHVSRDEDDPLHMPPDFTLWDRQIDTIAAWAAAGAPKGPPLPGNREPTMELTGDFESDGDLLVASYRIDDLDFDLVTGRLIAEPDDGGDPIVATWDLFSGDGQIRWDVTDVPSGSYDLSAVIDDASSEVSTDLGSVDVP